ncbi:MAG: tRNA pseudouridine(38-40) synthase TruA [Bryobacterales bacterium]|nr:tRNA pseudouridine(38-40) synthase TruA [Bryobacterales bacterium]MBV9396860.1 tRNA pseudouridine(38-40) synthase TruA [Bryobacterales bacterium]
MQTFKLTLEYDGSRFSGWQDQINARTVQGELKQAVADLFKTGVDVQGAGRTDAGVHAVGQVAHLKFRAEPTRLTPGQILRELNERLPSSIAIVNASEAPAQFHARHDAVSRAYFYQISTRKTALAKRYVWWVKEPLDAGRMQGAAAMLPGRHDFAAFRAADPSKPGESTVVVVEAAEVARDENLIIFRVQASHFLWKMVRRLAGTLVRIGRGELELPDFARLLEGTLDRRFDIASWTAPASGLFLEGITYR